MLSWARTPRGLHPREAALGSADRRTCKDRGRRASTHTHQRPAPTSPAWHFPVPRPGEQEARAVLRSVSLQLPPVRPRESRAGSGPEERVERLLLDRDFVPRRIPDDAIEARAFSGKYPRERQWPVKERMLSSNLLGLGDQLVSAACEDLGTISSTSWRALLTPSGSRGPEIVQPVKRRRCLMCLSIRSLTSRVLVGLRSSLAAIRRAATAPDPVRRLVPRRATKSDWLCRVL